MSAPQKFLVREGGLLKQEVPTVVSAGEVSAGKIIALNEDGKLDKSLLPAGIGEEDMAFAKRIDFVTDDEILRGEAAVGSLESAPVWRIRKIEISPDGDVKETWAGGTDEYDKVWDDRASLVYA